MTQELVHVAEAGDASRLRTAGTFPGSSPGMDTNSTRPTIIAGLTNDDARRNIKRARRVYVRAVIDQKTRGREWHYCQVTKPAARNLIAYAEGKGVQMRSTMTRYDGDRYFTCWIEGAET